MNDLLDPIASARPIVLVDDDRAILEVGASFIRLMLGASVHCFDSPLDALRHFQAHPDDRSLIITDFDMPGMNGAELVRALRERAPELEAIVFSGRAEEDAIEAILPANCRFLSKGKGFLRLIEMMQEIGVAA
jgi:DNA-binding NtrC family response regulator